jgi:aryl-alcohol dehydrogenase-like predicted oxidoreductase
LGAQDVNAAGRASPAATGKFAARHGGAASGANVRADFYRPGWDGLQVASIGLGSYLGQPDAGTDARYEKAVRRYLQLGGNVIDTAINYRFQRSERAIGAALQAAVAAGDISRDEVVVCTKGGHLSFDGDWPADPDEWARATFLASGIAQPDEIVDGHCMAPAYLRHEIARSLANLQVACIDLYYLHNPEGQRAVVGDDLFRQRLREAFATLEVAVSQGHLGAYGAATWAGLRAHPDAPEYLSLEVLLETARDVAGDRHHFRAVQLPLNFEMLEAVGRANQPGSRGLAPLLQVAAEHDLAVMASASLLQGNIVGRMPDRLRAKFDPGLTDAQRGLQFARSAPGLTVALAGMSNNEHVEENMALSNFPPLTGEAWRGVFRS